jgi:hypothetical protein
MKCVSDEITSINSANISQYMIFLYVLPVHLDMYVLELFPKHMYSKI